MASGTVSCHRIYNVPPSAHSSSLGPSLAGPPAARTATAAEAMVATGGVSRSKLPTTCLLTEDHADLLTEGSRTMRNRPYQVLKSQVRTRVLFSMSTSCHARPSAAKAPSRRSARVPAAAVSSRQPALTRGALHYPGPNPPLTWRRPMLTYAPLPAAWVSAGLVPG